MSSALLVRDDVEAAGLRCLARRERDGGVGGAATGDRGHARRYEPGGGYPRLGRGLPDAAQPGDALPTPCASPAYKAAARKLIDRRHTSVRLYGALRVSIDDPSVPLPPGIDTVFMQVTLNHFDRGLAHGIMWRCRWSRQAGALPTPSPSRSTGALPACSLAARSWTRSIWPGSSCASASSRTGCSPISAPSWTSAAMLGEARSRSQRALTSLMSYSGPQKTRNLRYKNQVLT